ncbi:hypothetical protein GHO41_11600 [Pseudomonas sp. FSL R10-0399]|mgnify:FL=1|uniref:hypothetical protein n=1 Tax=Pseudomonas sp. FSL R10-0399 TaxID=2662194 RepID=UPI001295C0A1|nr:hypothetical protein [Pseudomonas sp. FSL R10-0399]MQT57986.1 hypothetical protein [Pseudomonas sp. FSL R10-0399]
MTDAYVFEVHHESEVIQVNGRESVRAKYAFNKQSMEFSENSDPSRILLTCGRQKGGGVLACIAIITKDEFRQATVPGDCYTEKSF